MLELINKFASESVSFSIESNPHKQYCMSIQDYINDYNIKVDNFINQEEMELCIQNDFIWEIRWYPDTHVCFCIIFCYNLENGLKCI